MVLAHRSPTENSGPRISIGQLLFAFSQFIRSLRAASNCTVGLRYTEHLSHFSLPMQSSILALLAAVKVPRNHTAAMQLLQLYTQSGHFFWTHGVVKRAKLVSFASKLAEYRIGRDTPGRAYDKTRGLASSHLVLTDSPDGVLPWVLISTSGRGGLGDVNATSIGTVRDARLTGQHILWKHYELVHLEKTIKRTRDVVTKKGVLLSNRTETIHKTTWTWRMTSDRYKGHEAFIASLAKHRDVPGLADELRALAMMPQFSGVRGQVLKLYAETKKLSSKFSLTLPVFPELPFMVKMPVYGTPTATLLRLHEG